MNTINSIYRKNQYFWPLIILLYLITRLINLKIIPIFTDESIYSYWAQVALHDPANRFISMTDGKQPLFIWLAAIAQIAIKDPLIATRMVSVFAGFGSLIGIYLLACQLFDKKVAKIALLLYIILPFTLLYDRMGLYDSLLTSLCVWVVYFSVKIAKKPQLDLALLNGITLGMALITKSSANFYLFLLPAATVFFNFKKNSKTIFLKYLFFLLITALMAEIIYNGLRLSAYFYIISQKNLTFIRSFKEVIQNPFENFISNSLSIVKWIFSYTQLPLAAAFIAGAVLGILKKNASVVYLLALIIAPFLAEAIFNKVLYPRFELFYYPFIILVIAYFISYIFQQLANKKLLVLLAVAIAVAFPAYKSIKLLTGPTKAGLPDSDANQYLNDWPAGYGSQQVVDFLKNQSKSQQVNIGTEGTFGVFPFSLNIYFYQNNNVHIYPYWPVDINNLPLQILDLAKTQKTYFVFNENQKTINNPNLRFIAAYKKGIGNSYMRLYQVSP